MDDRVIPFRIPMRMGFRGVTEREGVLIEGARGWGEFSPFPDYPDEVAAAWARSALASASDPAPELIRTEVPVNAIVPAVDAETAFRLVKESGCRTVKVKVAEGDDEARVAAVRDALGPHGKLRIDVNGKWSVDEAARMIGRLSRYDLEYVEQPTASLEEMAELRRTVDVPLAADESIRNADDPLRVAGLEAADIVVLKVQPLGGVRRCLEVAEAAGLPAVVSSAIETSVGLAAGLLLACCLPSLPYACGLGTASLLDGDVTPDPLVPVDGMLAYRKVAPDPPTVERFRLEGPEAERVVARFERARALAEATR